MHSFLLAFIYFTKYMPSMHYALVMHGWLGPRQAECRSVLDLLYTNVNALTSSNIAFLCNIFTYLVYRLMVATQPANCLVFAHWNRLKWLNSIQLNWIEFNRLYFAQPIWSHNYLKIQSFWKSLASFSLSVIAPILRQCMRWSNRQGCAVFWSKCDRSQVLELVMSTCGITHE